jgi:glycosyltransferase involved in cell wall biosynthesis
MPLRILQVLRAPVGGLFRHVADLTEELAARGHAVGIVADRDGGDVATAARFAALAPFAALGIHRLPIPRLFGPADLTTPLHLAALARRLEIDVVHGHGAKGGFAARLVRRFGGAPVALYTPHGGVLHYPPRSISGRVFRLLERGMLAQTDAVVFESVFARDAFSDGIAAPPCPDPVIHNGLRPAEFVPITPGPDARDFGFVGEFRALKGIRYLLEAMAGLETPDGRPATLVMAGDGPDRAEFEALIARLGLGARVELVGVRPARDIFARGRCVVVPSLAESLPYVVLEAAAAGRPLIATRVGGVAEIFGPTAHSLVTPANTAALAAAMRTFLADPAAAEHEAAVRGEFIRPRFSVAHMTDAIEALYRELVAERGRVHAGAS